MSSVSKPRVRHNRHKQGLNLTLEKLSADFREYNYEKSDKTKDASYLNSVIESESGNPISAFF